MTRLERSVCRGIDLWAKRLGLSQTWHIDVKFKDEAKCDGEPVHAMVTWQQGYTQGEIVFNSTTLKGHTPAFVEHLIIHELIHLYFARIDDSVKRQSKQYVATAEEVVDKLATTIQRAYSRKTRIV